MLLPHVALELQFVGDSLPPESDQQHFTMQRVRARGGAHFSSPVSVAWWDPPLSLHLPLSSVLPGAPSDYPDFQRLSHPTPGPTGWP